MKNDFEMICVGQAVRRHFEPEAVRVNRTDADWRICQSFRFGLGLLLCLQRWIVNRTVINQKSAICADGVNWQIGIWVKRQWRTAVLQCPICASRAARLH